MKKIVILLSLIMLASGVAYAAKYPKYDLELSKIRTVKNAQTAEINKQISELEVNIENFETDTSITAAQKNAKTVEYKNKINELTIQKNRIAEKYKVDKKKLQIMYKH